VRRVGSSPIIRTHLYKLESLQEISWGLFN
jgi:hypothetical protein